jgi:hypothetical protein
MADGRWAESIRPGSYINYQKSGSPVTSSQPPPKWPGFLLDDCTFKRFVFNFFNKFFSPSYAGTFGNFFEGCVVFIFTNLMAQRSPSYHLIISSSHHRIILSSPIMTRIGMNRTFGIVGHDLWLLCIVEAKASDRYRGL